MEASNDERLHRNFRRNIRGRRRDVGPPRQTETVRVLADDPALKLASMRTER